MFFFWVHFSIIIIMDSDFEASDFGNESHDSGLGIKRKISNDATENVSGLTNFFCSINELYCYIENCTLFTLTP